MEVSEVRYAGFWKRFWAAVTDALFFQLVVFVIMLAVGRSDYLGYLEARFATISRLAEGPIDVSAFWTATGSGNPPILLTASLSDLSRDLLRVGWSTLMITISSALTLLVS
jgi:hypothetical protein